MRQFLYDCRRYFVYAGLFSLFINVLMLTFPIYMMQLYDRVITSRSEETLIMLTIAALSAFFLHMMLEMLRGRLLLGAGIALDGLAGPPVLSGVLGQAVRPGTNEYISGLRDVATVRSFLTGSGIFALFDSPWAPIYLGVIFLFHVALGVLATFGAATLFLLAYINERVTREPLRAMSRQTRQASYYIDSGMRNAEVISALGMVDDLTRRWRRLNSAVIDAQVTAGRRGSVLSGLTRFVRLSLQIVMLGVGAFLVIRQHLTPGIMIAGTLILSRALSPVESAIHTWKAFVDARDAFRRLNELLEKTPKAVDRVALPAPAGRLEVDHITFGIPGQDRLIIRNVSFGLDAGQSLGLVGPSAAGKSTLARLAIGIWRPTTGSVRLDGADVSTWPRDQLGPFIGYLPQDVELFLGTVGENIARLKQAPAEDVVRAAQRAHVHDMIVRLPQAYDTQIGDAGANLSAGQRQRVALARALFGDPRFVVLDEPNSNLDSEGEEALVQALRGLRSDGVTLIVISHRPSLLAGVDKLLVLKGGQVEIFGPRADVLAKVTPRGGPGAGEPGPVAIAGRQS